MNKKILFAFLIITTLLIANVETLYAKVNTKKDPQKEPTNKNDENTNTEKNYKGLAKGKNKNNLADNDPIILPPPPDSPPTINLDVYEESTCISQSTNIDWGEITIGSSQNITLYIKNNGEIDTFATLLTENWSLEANREYIDLSWDYNGKAILPNQIVSVTLTLSIQQDCPTTGYFNFDVVIIGS